MGTPENLESRNRNPVGLQRGGWEMVAWMDLVPGCWPVALSRRCVGVQMIFILTSSHEEILGEMMIPNFDLPHIFADRLKVETSNYRTVLYDIFSHTCGIRIQIILEHTAIV